MTRCPRRSAVLVTAGLFLAPALIWGSTWIAITWQLGVVAPEVSVTYRFTIAALLLSAACLATRRSLRFAPRDHAFLASVGLLMICANYTLIYRAELLVASGLVAVAYSTIVFMTPIAMRVAFGVPLRLRLLVAAAAAVIGLSLVFLPEIGRNGQGAGMATGIAFTLAAAAACAAGNAIVVRNHGAGIATIPGTAWTMAYGALFAALVAVANDSAWTFDARPAYIASLAYLAVFGSVVAFVAYFTLLARVGAGPSSYVAIATPVLALLLSTLLEGYRWTAAAAAGAMLAVLGIWLALRGPAAAGRATPNRC